VSGRKPVPARLNDLRGNPGKRKKRKEPEPEVAETTCPGWLEGEAKEEWDRLAPELKRLGLLTVVDLPAFAGYCQSFKRWREAERAVSIAILAGGLGIAVSQGLEGMARERLRLMKTLAAEFGFTPASRSKVSAKPQEEKDPFEDFAGLQVVNGGRSKS
jgi:P27 family predicted phage terminase small subunit